jgi:DMSO/TMAO reductase YedYZ molybdopterin-dependent catalytic subunit
VLSNFPFSAQTPSQYLSNNEFYYTPPKKFFERNHNLIPQIDPEDYELLLMPNGCVDDEEAAFTLSIQDIKAMPQSTLVSYISCAGNKRIYLQNKYPNIKGLKWTQGAIGNAKFKGVSMRYILLEKMGLKEADLAGKHLIAYAYDADF